MTKIMECIPNFSEGRNPAVLQGIADIFTAVKNVTLINHSADASHNRSVYTIVGDPQQVCEAMFQAVKYSIEKIDLRLHQGEHPRIGAVDVIPLVPLCGMTMEEAVAYSRQLACRLGQELDYPVFLYEESAVRPERKHLEDIRRGEFEGLKQKMTQPQWQPDFGPIEPHPSAGAGVVGARMPLIAYNINLNTAKLSVAQAIAKTIRQSSGGLPYVKAIGVMLNEKGLAQVSINVINYNKTPLYRIFEMVRSEARAYGVTIAESELIGMIPMNALADTAKYYLQMTDFTPQQILENSLLPQE